MAGKVTPIRRSAKSAAKPATLREVVDSAVAGMDWLEASDRAVVALAQAQADAIETADDRSKAVGWIGPQLLATLRALGGTPGDRKSLGVEQQAKGKLAELRKARGKAG